MTLRNWQSVARKDFQDAMRSKTLYVITGLFVLFIGGLVFLFAFLFESAQGAESEVAAVVSLLTSLNSATSIFVPLLGLAVGYNAIAGERDTGQIKLLLSLPHTRSDVLVGKLLGRTAVMFIAVTLGFLVAAFLTLVQIGAFPPEIFLFYFIMTLVYAFTFVAIGVSLSALTSSRTIAAFLAFGLFALFQFVWGFAVNALVYVRTGNFPLFGLSAAPQWAQFLQRLNPTGAFAPTIRAVLRVVAPGQVAPAPPNQPIYLQDGVGMFILLAWIVLPLVVAYFVFSEADLT